MDARLEEVIAAGGSTTARRGSSPPAAAVLWSAVASAMPSAVACTVASLVGAVWAAAPGRVAAAGELAFGGQAVARVVARVRVVVRGGPALLAARCEVGWGLVRGVVVVVVVGARARVGGRRSGAVGVWVVGLLLGDVLHAGRVDLHR